MTKEDNNEEFVYLKLSKTHAVAVGKALDLYSRVATGQIQEISALVRNGTIPLAGGDDADRIIAPPEVCTAFSQAIDLAKAQVGYSAGGQLGISHKNVGIDAKRCYEVQCVLDQALAMNHNPTPSFKSVRYDGLVVRYTNETAPYAEIK